MLYSCKKDAAQKGAGTMDGIHEGHRARMKKKLLENGERSLADHELLEVLLYYAIPRRDTNELAHRLLKQFGSLRGVLSAPVPWALCWPTTIPAAWRCRLRRILPPPGLSGMPCAP